MSQDKVIETFDRWVEEGKDAGLEQGHGDVVRQLIGKMGLRAGERVLDLGCGNGWATRLIAQTEAGVQAIGVDASPKMIAKADELHSYTIRARYDFCPFEALDFKDEEFDRVFSMEAIYYTSDVEKTLAECLRVMKPGAKADILLDFYEENTSSVKWGEVMGLDLHLKSEAGWVAAFEAAGFTSVSAARLIDSRGPGEEADFQPSECTATWADRVAGHEAGTLWIHAEKPA